MEVPQIDLTATGNNIRRIRKELGISVLEISELLMIDAYCRVDFLMDGESGVMYCLEANSLPGMTPTSLIPQMAQAMGISFGEVCERIIAASLKKYEA